MQLIQTLPILKLNTDGLKWYTFGFSNILKLLITLSKNFFNELRVKADILNPNYA